MTLVNNILTILNTKIYPGESKEIDFDVANLHTSSPVNVPIIIERAKNLCHNQHGFLLHQTLKAE